MKSDGFHHSSFCFAMDYPQENVVPIGYEGSKSEQIEQMFDHIAPTYDKLNHTLSLGVDRYWRNTAIKALKSCKPQRILDVATGTGDFAILAAQHLNPQQLIGIDISEGMMAVARKKVADAGLSAEQVSFQRDDCTKLSFPDNSFDAVSSTFGIRNFEQLDKALTEMYRVLTPGGQLVILELSTPKHFPMKQLYKFYSKTMIPLIGKCISRDNSAYTYLPDSIKAFPQGEVLQESLLRAGFSKAIFRRLTFGICTLYIATK